MPVFEPELDDDYRGRIVREVVRPKSNGYALAAAASEYCGCRVEIFEPWVDLFYLDSSRLDRHRTFDGKEWAPYLFVPVVYVGTGVSPRFTEAGLLALLDRLRPSGVMILPVRYVYDHGVFLYEWSEQAPSVQRLDEIDLLVNSASWMPQGSAIATNRWNGEWVGGSWQSLSVGESVRVVITTENV